MYRVDIPLAKLYCGTYGSQRTPITAADNIESAQETSLLRSCLLKQCTAKFSV